MPQVFGWQHLSYDFVAIVFMVVGLIYIYRHVKSEKQIRLLVQVIGAVLLAAILWNRISVCYLRDGFSNFLPSTYCGITSLALSIAAIFLKKNHAIFHALTYVGLMGGLLTLIYPDFIGQADSIWYSMTISGLLHHTIMVFLVLVMFMTGYVVPSFKKWYILPIGLSFYIVLGVILMTEFGYSDAMYIFEPALEGTIFNYLGLGCIFLPVHAIFLWIWDHYLKFKLPIIQITA
ncbi:MAG: hypothetical protein WCR19_06515 [Acholeplasmataceae bacterium]